jgi:naphthalene 1,2-dioxygenase system ferredoxin subunit
MSGPAQAATPDSGGEWTALGTVAEIFGERACRSMVIDGVQIGLFMVNAEIYAIDDICSHGNARLSEGELEGFEVECPLHAGLFDIRSGKALTPPVTRDVRSYPVRRDGDILLVMVGA